jgi:hypothetical protein
MGKGGLLALVLKEKFTYPIPLSLSCTIPTYIGLCPVTFTSLLLGFA